MKRVEQRKKFNRFRPIRAQYFQLINSFPPGGDYTYMYNINNVITINFKLYKLLVSVIFCQTQYMDYRVKVR